MKSIPSWALKFQREMEKEGMVPKFKRGDIVMVAKSEMTFSGVGVITDVADSNSQWCEYDIDFGPKGAAAWYQESLLTLIKRSL